MRNPEEDPEVLASVDDTDRRMNWMEPRNKVAKQPKPGAITKLRRQNDFLAAFKHHHTITHAAKAAGINPATHHQWLNKDNVYRQRWAATLQEVRDDVQKIVGDMALRGFEQRVYDSDGELVGTKMLPPSPLLTMFHAKRMVPEYNDSYRDMKARQEAEETKAKDSTSSNRIRSRLLTLERRITTEVVTAEIDEIPPHEDPEVIDITPEDNG